MSTFKIVTATGKQDYIEARNKQQALIAAMQVFPRSSLRVMEATPEEVNALIRSHSLPMKGE